MRIAVLGGGPGGLYFAALAKQLDARHDITIWERNAADDTFGFGVVFSDETLGGIEHADVEIFHAMRREFARWDDIDVHFRGTTFTSGGHGFAAMSRKRLLAILQARCAELGVRVLFRTEAPDVAALAASYDLVVAADGANSLTRAKYAATFGPNLERRRCKYIWLGTDLVFDAFKFYILDTPAGIMQVHGYPYSDRASTFILEMHEDVWRRAGFTEAAGLMPGQSDERLDRTHPGPVRAPCSAGPVVASTAWWPTTPGGPRSPRSGARPGGTRTWCCSATPRTPRTSPSARAPSWPWRTRWPWPPACTSRPALVGEALAAYEAERRPVVASTQRAAQASLEWFENLGQYAGQDPHQFAFNIMTRSRRVTYDNLRLRDPEFVAAMDEWFAASQEDAREACPPMFQPFRIGRLELANRVIVSPMDMYSAARRRAGRLPPGAPGQQGAGRRGAGDDRDGLRLSRRADHARLHGHLHRRAGGILAAGHRLRARADRREDRHPARALRPQGLHPADVGGDGRPAARGQLGGLRPFGAALHGAEPDAARADRGGAGRDQGPVRRRGPGRGAGPDSTCSSCTARTATCCPRSCPR